MTTVEEAQTALGTARNTLFPGGQWEEIYTTLHEPYGAQVLTGTDQGEMAFYLGEACMNTNRPEASTYFQDAYRLGSTDFSAWAEEEYKKLQPQAAADPNAPEPAEAPAADGSAAQPQQPAVDVSGHPDLQLNSPHRDWVAHAQAKLAHLQYYNGRIDGYFGPITDAAVRQIQEAYGMPADGIIGKVLWSALETHAPGVTGHPDTSAAHAQAGHDQAGHAPAGHAAAGHADPNAADPNAGTMTMPADSIHGGSAPADTWNPETPNVGAPEQAHEHPAVSEAGEVEISTKIKVGKDFGPVTVKEIPIKISGKLSGEKGKYVAITNSVGSKQALKIDTGSLKLLDGEDWKISLKGSAEISASAGISGTLEVVNGHFFGEIKFTLVKLDKGEYHFAEVTGSIGGKVADEPVHLDDSTVAYLTGKVQAGVTLAPNLAWFAEKGMEATAETAGTAGTAAAGGEAGAVAGGTEAGTTAAEGGGAVLGAEAIITTGFIAGAVAVLYVGYANMRDIDKLKQLRTDADKAVQDFATGFVSAWTKGAAPGGYWGGAGAAAGQKQFDADVHNFEAMMRKKYPGQVLDAATMDAVKEQWHQTAAEKQNAFESVAEAMFGKMVRTAIYQAWLKANSESSLPGDIRETAKNYAGITGGGSEHPDVLAGQAAAKNANIQLDIDRWQHALDE